MTPIANYTNVKFNLRTKDRILKVAIAFRFPFHQMAIFVLPVVKVQAQEEKGLSPKSA